MTGVRAGAGGDLVVESERYRLHVAGDGLVATLLSPDGGYQASLRPLAALDSLNGPDETLAVEPPRLVPGPDPAIEVVRHSTRWQRAALTLRCLEDAIELEASASGRGALTDVHLLAARSLLPGRPTGFLPSGSRFRTLFSPNPGDPARVLRSAAASAVIGVAGDSEPGRGHWFFTPAPLYFGLSAGDEEAEDGWLGVAIAAPIGELTFGQLVYQAGDRAFSLRLDYEAHTAVEGDFRTPLLVLTPGTPDPYTGLRRHRDDLVARRAAPIVEREPASWWSEPSFCGWGAQCHLAATAGGRAAEYSTQARYDGFLDYLERHGVAPGTVVIDDKWQACYGTCEPDRAKWPDLRGWIAERHERGQRVLLWWKAWDPEGLAPELCIRNPDGAPIALDPTNARARAALGEIVERMLSHAGLDADGLKIDFTGAAPSGAALTVAGGLWGIALLHELLAVVHFAAKGAKGDALLVTHTPHPAFADVTDMVRLNDLLHLGDIRRLREGEAMPEILPQMRYRAAVVRASLPGVLVDTDDWCAPSRSAWRDYVAIKPELGVPSLYYATHLDLTGEALEHDDFEALRRTWSRWRCRKRGAGNESPAYFSPT